MSSFNDLWSELSGQVPRLPDDLAQRFINRAWRDVRDSRMWSFLMATGYYFSPSVITSGAVTATRFSTSVTLDATAAAALGSLANPTIDKRQFRVAGGATPYFISSIVGTTLTLTSPFLEQSFAGGYQVYRCIYGYPLGNDNIEVTDFLRHSSIRNISTARYFTSLRKTRFEIDDTDPQRSNQSEPYWLASYDADPATNRPRWEMWPHPTSDYPFWVSYQKRGADMTITANESLPDAVPDQLVLARALEYAAKWAGLNKGRWDDLKGVDWSDRAQMYFKEYNEVLKQSSRDDEETFPQDVIRDETSINTFPVDSAFLQNHDFY